MAQTHAAKLVPGVKLPAFRVTVRKVSCTTSSTMSKSGSTARIVARTTG